MKKILIIVGVVIVVLVVVAVLYTRYIRSIQAHNYTVVAGNTAQAPAVDIDTPESAPTPEKKVWPTSDIYEIREYEPMLVAQVELDTMNFRNGSNGGFSILAGYIFGGNTKREGIDMTSPVLDEVQSQKIAMTSPVLDEVVNEKIAMTSPVLDEMPTEGEGGKRLFSFIMPAEYTMDNLPIPNDDRVILKEIPARTMAVITFSGWWSEAKFDANYAKLKAALDTDGVQYKDGYTRASYDPPGVPPMLRTNEIMIEVIE